MTLNARQKRLVADRVRRMERLLVREAELATKLQRVRRKIAALDGLMADMQRKRAYRKCGELAAGTGTRIPVLGPRTSKYG